MSTMLIQSDTLTDIADAIRDRLGTADTYLPSEMPDAIESIIGGGGGDIPNGITPPNDSIKSDIYLQVVEHGVLNADGASYIDTGVYPSANHRVVCEFATLDALSTEWDTVFGCRNGSGGRFTARFDQASTTGQLGIHHCQTPTTTYESYVDEDITKTSALNNYKVIDLSLVYRCDGDIKKYFAVPASDSAFPYTIYLFATHDANNGAINYGQISMKYCAIYDDNGELIRYFVPNSDGNMYDMVNNTIYNNSGIGSFTYSDDIKMKSVLTWHKINGVWKPMSSDIIYNVNSLDFIGSAKTYNRTGVNIGDGFIISGFTDRYYALFTDKQIGNADSWKINVRFKCSSISSPSILFGAIGTFFYAPSVEVHADGSIWAGYSTDGATWDYFILTNTGIVDIDTWYDCTYEWDGTTLTLTLRDMDNNIVETQSISVSTKHYSTGTDTSNFEFGGVNNSSQHTSPYLSIDLVNTYIEVANEIVWGIDFRVLFGDIYPVSAQGKDGDYYYKRVSHFIDISKSYGLKSWSSSSSSSSTQSTAGWEFYPTKDMDVIALKAYARNSGSTATVLIADMDGNILAQTSAMSITVYATWFSEDLPTPLHLTANTHYVIQVIFSNTNSMYYAYDSNCTFSDDITYVQGRYGSTIGTAEPNIVYIVNFDYDNGNAPLVEELIDNQFRKDEGEWIPITGANPFVDVATRAWSDLYIGSNSGVIRDTSDPYCLCYSWKVQKYHRYRLFSGQSSQANRTRWGFNQNDLLGLNQTGALISNLSITIASSSKSFSNGVTAPIDGYLIAYLYNGATGENFEFYLMDVTYFDFDGLFE